jgi:serine/threonine protein kinase
VDGQSLSHFRLTRPKQILEVRDLEKRVSELCEALEYAYKDVGLIDVDIVPGNLVVDRTGNLKVKDFGIANCLADSMNRWTAIPDLSETLQYRSPQRLAGDKPAITDAVYSLGAAIYELLTGKPPFYAGDMGVQVSGKIPPLMIERRAELGIAGEAIPKSWEETVAACLANDPLQRPQSAIEVGKRLKNANSSSDISVQSPVNSVPDSIATPPARTPSARKAGLVAVGIGFMLALGSAVGLFSLRHLGIGRHGYEPEMSIVSDKREDQEPLQRVQFVPFSEPAHSPVVPLAPSGPNGKDSAQSVTALSPGVSPTPSSEIRTTLFPPETATSYENQIASPSPALLSERDIDATTEDVVKRIKAVPGVSAQRKADLIEKMHRARSMERLTVIPFDAGQTALRRGATDGLVKTFDRPGIRDKLSDPTVVLVVAGYADIVGRPDLNLHFSQERAENVSKILKEQAKLSNAMQMIGMGGTDLLDSKRPESNRAVEIWAVVPL